MQEYNHRLICDMYMCIISIPLTVFARNGSMRAEMTLSIANYETTNQNPIMFAEGNGFVENKKGRWRRDHFSRMSKVA